MAELLKIDRVSKRYERRGRETVHALREANLGLDPGELRFVLGSSGSGKSTLLLCAGGLLRPDEGTVTLDGEDLYALSPDERSSFRARHIGFVFQQFHLVPYLSVLDNVLAPALAFGGDRGGDLRSRAESLVERFGLGHRRDHPPSELSVGERQRCALARALLHEPRLILADEPTGNLDEENGALVMECLREFAAGGGAVLVVTHDPSHRSDESYELAHGVLGRGTVAREP